MRYLLILLFFFPFLAEGQVWHIQREIQWKENITAAPSQEGKDVISFQRMNKEFSESSLPYWSELMEWKDEFPDVEVSIYRAVYEEIPEGTPGLEKYRDAFSDHLNLTGEVLYSKKKPYLQLQLTPFRINPQTGKPERLLSFVVQIESSPRPFSPSTGSKKSALQENSVLASGNWFKIKVPETGIYKLSYEDLSSLGLANPANVRIFGWGGQVLPEDATLGEQDDLLPTQIYMNKGSDGSFGPGDYILFYAQGPVSWNYDPEDKIYEHVLNPYSSWGYYFVTSDHGASDLPGEAEIPIQEPDYVTDTYDFRSYHEQDLENVMGTSDFKQPSGREWYGEDFNYSNQRSFNVEIPGLVGSQPVLVESFLLGRAKDSSFYYVYGNQKLVDTIGIKRTNLSDYTAVYAYTGRSVSSFFSSTESINLKYVFDKPDISAKGWMDYFTLNARADLQLGNSPLFFRESRSIGEGPVVEFKLKNAGNSTIIWDVTDPHKIQNIVPEIAGSVATFKLYSDENSEYVAFNTGFDFPSPVMAGEDLGPVENQNLHGSGFPDMIIVTYPGFMESAEKLANYRKENNDLDVLITTPEKVFNEFSSGKPDVTAIRNFMRYLYVKAGADENLLPRFLLLLGDGSYAYKTDDPNLESKVITYQSANSLAPIRSYVSDDYFVLLDAGEDMNTGLLDMGVGRLPVNTPAEAELMVDKIIYYESPDRMGEWRNAICFIGDDEDYNTHLNQANELAEYVNANYPYFNVNKIFLDAYKQISTPVGQRYPAVNQAINDQIAKGALIINYTGHGSPKGLAHEKILELNDIVTWENYNKLPLFITATCEFSRYDDPEIVSAGEEVIINPDGGGIALLTTTRLVYSGPNHALNERFYEIVFEKDAYNNNYTLGEILVYTKNHAGSGINKRNFTLLGDPSMRLTYPYFKVATDSIDGTSTETVSDTLKALKKVTVSGHIEGLNGEVLTSFNGLVYPVVFDKTSTRSTLGNDGEPIRTFEIRNSILYKGAAQVKQGRFSFSFIVPKDIRYSFGRGKLSYYAMDSIEDASGASFDFLVGGSYENPEIDVTGPEVDVYMNSEEFRSGGITDENPVLLVKVFDEHGINTAGNGIGHDITAVLDDDYQNSIVLNEYYTADVGSYQSGTVSYPFFDLEEGKHLIRVKVWDVYNNSAEDFTEFVVVTTEDMILENIMNYPNPFTDQTEFSFEHNKPSVDLDITINIYDLSGSLVKTIRTKQYGSGYRSEPIIWNGENEANNMSRQGVYIYRIKVKTSEGTEAEESGKLILIR